jgi:hypothetical protein
VNQLEHMQDRELYVDMFLLKDLSHGNHKRLGNSITIPSYSTAGLSPSLPTSKSKTLRKHILPFDNFYILNTPVQKRQKYKKFEKVTFSLL